ncbi:MAG TPA: cytochrome d ubiquinol oxidase subunit II [Candidatus Acidoferrales bacterium]|nr:cytochrome d ubiquinol oxidase subunit II [Candidatus Acidoferrales bacterium]
METIWFCLISVMIAIYVVLDGFDLGAGIIHLSVARTDAERRAVLASISPVWDGNEVWLLAAGGTLYFAFPALYAAGFSGFYLPLMIVLWLLILRGCAIEFRNHMESPVWAPFWDVVFCGASALLAVFFGAALGNVVRGVPLDASGWFFEPLWTNFRLGADAGILDWYTVLVGVAAYFALTLHGALWVALRTEGIVRERARRVMRWSWWGAGIFTLLVTWATFSIQPQVPHNFVEHPWGAVFPLLALGGLAGVMALARRENSDFGAFLASCAYLVGMLTSVVFGVYPYVLPACTDAAYSLTIYNAAAGGYGLRVGIVWWVIGIALATGYFLYLYRHAAGRIKTASRDSQ